MSEVHKLQDATGRVILSDGYYISMQIKLGAPTASATGYQIGCLYIRKDGTSGGILYVNIGTTSSATWQNLV